MNTVVYSASPLWIYLGTFAGLAFLIVLGIFGLTYAAFRRREKMLQRIFMAILGLFLCAMGVLGLGFSGWSILNGAKTATVLLDNKRIAEDNCGDSGTCKRLVLESRAGAHSYDFTVEQRAFDATEKGACYRVTYYINQGLFGTNSDTDLYLASDHVTQIEQMQPGACQ